MRRQVGRMRFAGRQVAGHRQVEEEVAVVAGVGRGKVGTGR